MFKIILLNLLILSNSENTTVYLQFAPQLQFLKKKKIIATILFASQYHNAKSVYDGYVNSTYKGAVFLILNFRCLHTFVLLLKLCCLYAANVGFCL